MAKIAHVTTVSLGLRYLLLNQLDAIQRAGHEVYGISAPGPEIAEVEGRGIRCLPTPMTRRVTPLVDLIALWRLYRLMRRERFDVVHTHTPKGALLGQYAALLAGVPLRVHTIHGLYFPGHMNPRRRWLFVLLERITMLFSHLNLSQNPEDVPVAIEEGICRAGRIELIGNGIDITAFDPALYPRERRREIRRSLGLEAHHQVVGIIARFVAEKGYLELLEAARIITSRSPDVRFILVGGYETEKRDALHPNVIRDMGLEGVVLYLGHRTDVADLYAAMDVLALPSHREGFPRVPMEAAAMGVPAVVTNIRGCRQTVDDGRTGYLVPLRDPSALAEALWGLLEDGSRREAFGRAAREKALDEFDERIVFGRVINAYRRLLENASQGLSGMAA